MQIINVLLLQSLLKLMFSKLEQFITLGIFWFLLNAQARLSKCKCPMTKITNGTELMERSTHRELVELKVPKYCFMERLCMKMSSI